MSRPVGHSAQSWLTVAEAAGRIGVKHQAIRRAIARGELPATKVVSRVRIAPADFAAWLAANRVTPLSSEQPPMPTARPANNGLGRLARREHQSHLR